MRNRIINLCLAAIMLFSCFGSAYAAGNAESIEEAFEKKYEILTGLEILNPVPDGEYVSGEYKDYQIFKSVSKSEFINYLCNMSGDYGYSSQQSDEAIATAEGMGIISPGQNDLNKPLCYEEAVTMLVRLMDYKLPAEQAGGFPTGYIALAQNIGILKGVSATYGESLNYMDVVNLLYNALNCVCAKIDYFSDNGNVVYKNESDVTFLYQFRKLYRVDGVIDTTDTSELRSGTTTSKGKIMIDGYIYATQNDYSDYLGMKCECYVKEDGDSGEDTVVMAFPMNNKVIEIEAEDIDGISSDYRSLSYYVGNRTKTALIPLTAAVIYNGVPMTSKSKDKYKPETGGIKLIDNNQDGSYEVVSITSYKTFIVDAVSLQNEKVTNKLTYDSDGKEVVLGNKDNYDDIIKIVLNGKEITVNDLSQGDVLLVAEGKGTNGRVVRAIVSNDRVAGSVSKTSSGDYTVITVNGVDYEVSKYFETAQKKGDAKAIEIKVGTAYAFSLDAEGRIAFAEKEDGSESYGIIYRKGTKGKLDKTGVLKLFNLNGELETLDLAEKVSFINPNGTSGLQTAENVINALEGPADGKVNLIKYAINANGEINKIEVAQAYANGNNGSFNVLSNTSGKSFRTENQSFESELFIDTNAKLFMVSLDDLTDESSYSKTTAGSLNGGTNYPYQAYNVDEYCFAKIIVLIPQGSTSKEIRTTTSPMLVASKGSEMNAGGEVKGSIEGMQGNYDSITYTCEDSVYDAVSEGDLIFVTLDANGTVYDYTRKFDTSMIGKGFTNYTHIHSDKKGVFGGTVTRISAADGRMTVNISEDGSGSDIRNLRLETSKLSVALYTVSTSTIERGSIGDIEVGDYVVVGTSQSNVNTVVIYRQK